MELAWLAFSSFRPFLHACSRQVCRRDTEAWFLVCGYFLLGSAYLSEQCVVHFLRALRFQVFDRFLTSLQSTGLSVGFARWSSLLACGFFTNLSGQPIRLFTAQSLFCATCVFKISTFLASLQSAGASASFDCHRFSPCFSLDGYWRLAHT